MFLWSWILEDECDLQSCLVKTDGGSFAYEYKKTIVSCVLAAVTEDFYKFNVDAFSMSIWNFYASFCVISMSMILWFLCEF